MSIYSSLAPTPTLKTILVVEDNPFVVKALSTLIGREGFEPVPCQRGNDAIVYCESAHPAAAVIDVHLPDISGLILAQKLRERFGPRMPIIVVSGDTSMETINSLAHVGATYFFSKPVNATALIERLKELTADASRVAG